MKFNKNRFVHYFVIIIFALLYAFIATISSIHVIDFFQLSNNLIMSIALAVAFEMGAAASLASVVVLDKMNKTLVWGLFILLTAFQCIGNVYYAYVHLAEYQYWTELFGLNMEPIITQKRIISIVSGAILPVVALGFIKALVDYIKPDNKKQDDSEYLPTKQEAPIKPETNNDITKKWEDSGLLDNLNQPINNNTSDIFKPNEKQVVPKNEEVPVVNNTSDFESIIDRAIPENKDTYDEKKKSYLDVRK